MLGKRKMSGAVSGKTTIVHVMDKTITPVMAAPGMSVECCVECHIHIL